MHLRLATALRLAIQEGRLAPNERLPSTRNLASELNVSRTSVVKAYDRLTLDGYVEGRPGAGTWVSVRPEFDRTIPAPPQQRCLEGAGRPTPPAGEGPFALETVDVRDFPLTAWRRTLERRARSMDREVMGVCEGAGLPALRAALSRFLSNARGVRCEPERILVLAGVRQALDLVLRFVIRADRAVWLEDPGDPRIRAAVLGAGARVVPVPVDSEGLVVAAGRRLEPAADLACITPSHQCPLGISMTLERRIELLEWAEEQNAWVFEDDRDSEYRYAGAPLASLQGLATRTRVLYAGTLGTALFPGLGIAYVVVPRGLEETFATLRSHVHGQPPPFMQAVVADFLDEGHLETHLRRVRSIYATRRRLVVEELRSVFGESLRIDHCDTGRHFAARFTHGVDDEAYARVVRRTGTSVTPLSRYAHDSPIVRGLVLGDVLHEEDQLRRAAAALGNAWRSWAS